jgi:hypothetical protein
MEEDRNSVLESGENRPEIKELFNNLKNNCQILISFSKNAVTIEDRKIKSTISFLKR